MFARPPAVDPRPRALGRWLLLIALLVFAIVIVGGITRLTESGLSITSWKPIRGIVPPLTDAQWQEEFAGYRRIPQYEAFNQGMTLAGFKAIYFWEYLHRLLARAIGTVLAVVLILFWWRRRIPAGYGPRCWLIFALGGLQGLIGWWMVASGLAERTEVSHIRLAIHLIAALTIYAVLIWTSLDLFALARGDRSPRRPSMLGTAAIVVLIVQIAYGALTAGLRAGYAFASWPLMGDRLFPDHGLTGQGIAHQLVDNPILVQFVHRWWAWAVAALAIALAIATHRAGRSAVARVIIATLALQISLGITTLLSGVAIELALMHQAVAAVLLATFIWGSHIIGKASDDGSYQDGAAKQRR